MIPRVFHRIWLGGRRMPAEFEAFGASWQRHHPEWQMKLWTEANLPPLINRWAFENADTRAGQADVLRYEILWRFGGVYIDTDFECLRNIEPLLADVDCFAGRYGDGKFEHGRFASINNAILGASPQHPFMRDLVEEVAVNIRCLGYDTPIAAYLTGPVFLTYVAQRHPEVKLFPPRYFYPYGPRERWRRHERFPRAYAVHHWSLNGLSLLQRPGRVFGTPRESCLSVVLHPARETDVLRCQWVFEALCAQTVSNFEVLLMHEGRAARLSPSLRRYQRRLRLRQISFRPRRGENSDAAARNAALRHARAHRVLFLDSDCMPDRDVVARHAMHADRPVLVYGYRRIYPRSKLFPFRDVIDFGGIAESSLLEHRNIYLRPSARSWRDVKDYCFSGPTEAMRAAGGFDPGRKRHEVRALAQRLAASGCPTLACLYGSTVTWLGPMTIAAHLRRNKRWVEILE